MKTNSLNKTRLGISTLLVVMVAGCASDVVPVGGGADAEESTSAAAKRVDLPGMLATVAIEQDGHDSSDSNVDEDSIGRIIQIRNNGLLTTLSEAQVEPPNSGTRGVRAQHVKQSVGVGNRIVTLGTDGSVHVIDDDGKPAKVLVPANSADPVVQVDAGGHLVIWRTKRGAVSYLDGPIGTKPVLWVKNGATQVAAMGCGRVAKIDRKVAALRCAERAMLGYLNKIGEFRIRHAQTTDQLVVARGVAEIAMAGQTLGIRKLRTNAFLTSSRNSEVTPDEEFERWRTVVGKGATRIRLGWGVRANVDGIQTWTSTELRGDTGPFAGYTDASGLWVSKVGIRSLVPKIAKTRVTSFSVTDFSLSYGYTSYRLKSAFILPGIPGDNLAVLKNDSGISTDAGNQFGLLGTGDDVRVSKFGASKTERAPNGSFTYLME